MKPETFIMSEYDVKLVGNPDDIQEVRPSWRRRFKVRNNVGNERDKVDFMLFTLFFLVLGWMGSLAPDRDHKELAWAIAVNATSEIEAAVFTAVAFRESSFRNDAVGDGGHSVCAFQIYDGPKALLQDPTACATRGAAMLRESRRIDPKNPIAFYARGPRWKNEEAQRISRDRMALATKLLHMKLTAVPPSPSPISAVAAATNLSP